MKFHVPEFEHHPDGCVTPVSDREHPIIRLDKVSMRYERRRVLQDACITVNYGDFVAVTGPNGGGKTTMLRLILGLLKPTSGQILRFMPDGSPAPKLLTGYLPQKNMVDSRFPILVREVVSSGLLATRRLSADQRDARVDEIISLIGLESHADAPIGSLSGGQLQRALLGRAIISRPDLLVLDEPLSYIDKRFESRLYDIIRDIAAETTVILVSHELSEIDHMANRHIIVDCQVRECPAHHHYVVSHCDC